MSAEVRDIPAGLVTVTSSDPQYSRLRSTYTTRHAPGVILLPRSDTEVARAIEYAADTDLPVSVRSGGHGLSGRSSNDGGIVIDLSGMAEVELVDAGSRLVRVGAGARWAHVASALSHHDLAISSGDHGNVGVGGLATAGGIGWLVRDYGLTIDHVRAATVVLPDGTIVRADAESEPDLLWAVRGAGSYVGIVTNLEIEAAHLPAVAVGQVAIEVDPAGAALRRWSEYMAAAPRALTMSGILDTYGGSTVLRLTAVVAGGDLLPADELLRPLEKTGRVYSSGFGLAGYAQLVPHSHLHPNVGQLPATTTNVLLRRLTSGSARALPEVARHPSRPFVQVRAIGGAINDVARGATAFAHRDAEVLVTATTFPPRSGGELDDAVRDLRRYAVGSYRNFESRPSEKTFARAFPGATGERLKLLTARYDPNGVLSRVDRQ